MELSLTEQLCYSTVRIECQNDKGQTTTGTGFFFNFLQSDDRAIPVVITNKHVVAGMTIGRFIMTKADTEGNPINKVHFTVTLSDLKDIVRLHPSDDVDLCALPVASLLNYATKNDIRLFFRSFDQNLLPTNEQLNELTALEDILMIGYPNGIWDSINNMPILRKGSTATHPCIDYNGNKEFMIDAACFPGSSGSPVLIYNPSGYVTKTGGFMMGSPRIILMGILFAGPQHTATGELKVVTMPTFQQTVAFSRIPNNLGVVIKSERILELEYLFKRN